MDQSTDPLAPSLYQIATALLHHFLLLVLFTPTSLLPCTSPCLRKRSRWSLSEAIRPESKPTSITTSTTTKLPYRSPEFWRQESSTLLPIPQLPPVATGLRRSLQDLSTATPSDPQDQVDCTAAVPHTGSPSSTRNNSTSKALAQVINPKSVNPRNTI